jgi:hypothetical protein
MDKEQKELTTGASSPFAVGFLLGGLGGLAVNSYGH